MFDLDKWEEIFNTIRQNKLRTFLTAFSVSWGIFMLILLLGAGSGLLNGVKEMFKDDAINSIWIRSGQTSIPYKGMQPGRRIQFTNEDYNNLKNKVEGLEHITARYFLWGDYTVRYEKKYSSFQVRGVHPAHLYLENTILTSGRYINDLDIEQKRKVAVIGQEVVNSLFENGDDPLGKWIDISGILYKVVGTFKDEGSEREQQVIIIPISTTQMAYNGSNRVHMMMFTVGDASVKESMVMGDQAKNLLIERHKFSPEDERAIHMWNNLENFQRFKDLFGGINIFIWIVGMGTIVAGVVGVSNIMLIIVKDRTREIGIRKALGATPVSIISLIIQESIVITLISGYFGLLFGVSLIELVNFALDNFGAEVPYFKNPEIELTTALTATGILVIAGALAGYFPARKAAKIQPIEALRDE